MRFLITGSSGFIGSKLTELLRARNIEFDIVHRSSTNQERGFGVLNVVWPTGLTSLDLKPYSAIIHLAAAPATQANETFLREANVTPIKNFLDSIKKTNPDCSFIFVTSQSANINTESIYGKLKWEAEELIRAHRGNWTIIRPGLVIGAEGNGLFNRLIKVVDLFPIVPLIGNGGQLLQPIGVTEVVEALVKVASDPVNYSRKDYPLAGAPISFRNFLETSAAALEKRRVFIPIPISFVNLGLSALEKLFKNPPVTKTNLLGLLSLELLDSKETCEELQIRIPALAESLKAMLSVSGNQMETEVKYFYKSLFGKLPSQLTISRYIAAHQYCCFVQSPEQKINIEAICSNRLDAESIEFATRSRKTLLTKKMTLISYLAEVEPSNYTAFVNTKKNFLIGFFALGLAVIRSPWKLLKGKYLVRRYNLV